mgnify:FL=1
MKICVAQLNYKIGDIENNTQKIADTVHEAKQAGADLVVFSELAVCGYPPDDLLDFPWFIEKCEQGLEMVAQSCQGIAAIVGGISTSTYSTGRQLHNIACFMRDGRIEDTVKKTLLPSYDVFNESRYFEPNREHRVIDYKGVKIGITICEDMWDKYNTFEYEKSPASHLSVNGAQLIINPSASPFCIGKQKVRNKVLEGNTKRFNSPIVYVNQVGAHNDLIFDGSSCVVNGKGEKVSTLDTFKEDVQYIHFKNGEITDTSEDETNPEAEEIKLIHDALVFGIKDYFKKMNFKTATLGSSGGIDSAVVQALASTALGGDKVHPVLMPSKFSSSGSVKDAERLSKNLGNPHITIPIKNVYNSYVKSLEPHFEGKEFDTTEENLQARARGVILMALSNKHGHILLNTSNKSEIAVGYSTLYGDMCGSLSPIGDVYKTKLYALAQYINRDQEIIPNEIINKAPSAELRPDQKDSDSLPDYSTLDEILNLFIEEQKGPWEIKSLGYDSKTVEKTIALVNGSEFKRFQSPPILRITSKAFGRGRIIPLVANYC